MSGWLALIAAAGAVWMDLRTQKVSNWFILTGLAAGAVYRLFTEGLSGIAAFAAGVFCPILILGILFIFGALGAGDIKLFAVLGGMMGVRQVMQCMLWAFLLGGALSFIILLSCGGIRRRLAYFVQYFQLLFITKQIRPYREGSGRGASIHFTVPVLMSVLLYMGGIYR